MSQLPGWMRTRRRNGDLRAHSRPGWIAEAGDVEEMLMLLKQNKTHFASGAALAVLACGLMAAPILAQSHPGGMPSQPPAQPSTLPGNQGQDPGLLDQQALNDQQFLRKALEGGAAEVQLGQLAEQKSQSDDVKQFARKMVDDHSQLDKQIEPIAKQLGVEEPNGLLKKDKQLITKLEGLSGAQFDEEYIRAMVKDHKEDLREFKDEAQMTQNVNVKRAATEGTTLISEHLQHIEQIAQSHNVEAERK
jgi:putative membrane protein